MITIIIIILGFKDIFFVQQIVKIHTLLIIIILIAMITLIIIIS